jgi:hypothetical protein
VIIDENKATLHELKTVYTVEDSFLLWETIAVARYNEKLAIDNAKKQKGV